MPMNISEQLRNNLFDQELLHAPGQTFLAEEHDQLADFSLDFLQKRKKGKVRVVEAPTFAYPIADTHAHLEMLSNPVASLARCACYGLRFICSITDPVEDMKTTLACVEQWKSDAQNLLTRHGLEEFSSGVPHIRVAMGCHPHNAKDYTKSLEDEFVKTLKNPLVCAIGEVGLDYHYDLSPREDQREVFKRQIQLAHESGLPLLLHMREAHDEGLEILSAEGFPEAGVLLHCFNLDPQTLKPWLDNGCYIAFGGPVTFNKADEVRESASLVSLDRLLTETDSPYMTPEPLRGMECGPEHTIFTVKKLLEVFADKWPEKPADQLEEELLGALYQNALSLLDREVTAWQVL